MGWIPAERGAGGRKQPEEGDGLVCADLLLAARERRTKTNEGRGRQDRTGPSDGPSPSVLREAGTGGATCK